jgi:hypothetical protein
MYPSSLEKALGMNWSPKSVFQVIISNENHTPQKTPQKCLKKAVLKYHLPPGDTAIGAKLLEFSRRS